MRKTFFAINSTISGFADHTNVIADDELHDFFTGLLNEVDVILFGRKTYQLMESYWPNARNDSRSTESEKYFADKINSVAKIVFSKTLTSVSWQNSRLSKKELIEEVSELKKQNGKNISIGSLSLASQLLTANLIDEYYFVVHPLVVGNGKRLFESSNAKLELKLIETIKFKSGAVVLHYHI